MGSRFPINFDAKRKDHLRARVNEEIRLQECVQAFKRDLSKLTGQVQAEPTLGRFVPYARWAGAFQKVWDALLETDGNIAQTWERYRFDPEVLAAVGHFSRERDCQAMMFMLRTEEFEAFRRDAEFAKCLAAQAKAFQSLEAHMGSAMAREHRYWEARRLMATTTRVAAGLSAAELESMAVDEADIEQAMRMAAEDAAPDVGEDD